MPTNEEEVEEEVEVDSKEVGDGSVSAVAVAGIKDPFLESFVRLAPGTPAGVESPATSVLFSLVGVSEATVLTARAEADGATDGATDEATIGFAAGDGSLIEFFEGARGAIGGSTAPLEAVFPLGAINCGIEYFGNFTLYFFSIFSTMTDSCPANFFNSAGTSAIFVESCSV